MQNEFLRVKLGEGAGMSRNQASMALERHLDAVVVHEVGFTITLFRQKGLPRPSNCPAAQLKSSTDATSKDSDTADSLIGTEVVATARLPRQRTSLKSAERAAAGKAEAKERPKGPAEFSIL